MEFETVAERVRKWKYFPSRRRIKLAWAALGERMRGLDFSLPDHMYDRGRNDAAMGYSVGTSLLEGDKVAFARQMLEQAGQNHVMLLLPVDTVAADRFAADAESKIVDIKAIPDGWMGMRLDIREQGIQTF